MHYSIICKMNKQTLYVPTWTNAKNDVEQKNASYRRTDTR